MPLGIGPAPDSASDVLRRCVRKVNLNIFWGEISARKSILDVIPSVGVVACMSAK